ncbi:hypothetical protein TNCV_2315341 [Trichonephila clavipes]|nr:hypothetical protein TNCV_2315341 [Trichonephila clavipes]
MQKRVNTEGNYFEGDAITDNSFCRQDGEEATSDVSLSQLDKLSANFEFHIQWIPSHVGSIAMCSPIERKSKEISPEFPPEHVWYPRRLPGGALIVEGHRGQQTCISQFSRGPLKHLTFELGLKNFLKICVAVVVVV